MNLMSNSVKFTRKGRIDLQIDWIDSFTGEEVKERHFQDFRMVVPRFAFLQSNNESIEEFHRGEMSLLRNNISRKIKNDPVVSGYSILTK